MQDSLDYFPFAITLRMQNSPSHMQDSLFAYAELAPRVCKACSSRLPLAYVRLELRLCRTCSSRMQDTLFVHAGLALHVCRTRSTRMQDLLLAYAGLALCVCRTRSSRMQNMHFAYEGLACQDSLMQNPLGSSRYLDSFDSFPFVITLRMQ